MSALKQIFDERGWVAVDGLLDESAVARLQYHFDEVVVHSRYETRRPPTGVNDFGGHMIKVSNAWLADETIAAVVKDRRITSIAAELLGVDELYLWADSLYWKAPRGMGEQGKIGWHQDKQYWATSSTDAMITACVALYQTGPVTGGMRFVDGSHRWGLVSGSDALVGGENEGQHVTPTPPHDQEWRESCPVLPIGSVTFHHCLTFHGSGLNLVDEPRRSVTIHMVGGDGHLTQPLPGCALPIGAPFRGDKFPRLWP